MNINKERVLKEFVELASIDSPSFNEREIADVIIGKAGAIGLSVYEDKGCEVYGGNTGNLYFTMEGDPNVPSLMMMAHIDTVLPCTNKKITIEGDVIKSDGTTILGGDDVAGIVSILETLRLVKEQNLAHGNIEVVLTFGEEHSLCGSKVLEFDKIKSKIALVLDGGEPIGTAAIIGPSQYQIEARFKGKAAHAGIEPEKGINAIAIASNAISNMKLGRLDFETTANVGLISGGIATNIVSDNCVVKFEARSIDAQKLENQVVHMRQAIQAAADNFGGQVEIIQEFLYPSFNIAKDDELIKIFEESCVKIGVEPNLVSTGGGSDTNIISGKGIKAIDMSCGLTDAHTLNETMLVSDLLKCIELTASIVQTLAGRE